MAYHSLHGSTPGVLTWNVSRGWEGYGYRLCALARHVPVPMAKTMNFHLFVKRCIFLVVPKCLRCYTSNDNLGASACFGPIALYGGLYVSPRSQGSRTRLGFRL
jgi:hypothetical protein